MPIRRPVLARSCTVTLCLFAVAMLGGCSSSDSSSPAAPHSTATNPGPNTTGGSTDPGPKPTSGGPQTINGVLTVTDGHCVRLAPRAGASTYELRLPSDLVPSATGITRAGAIVARPRDELFVAGHRTATQGTCGTIVFVVTQLVSVLPAR
jgi:hypothetical protein